MSAKPPRTVVQGCRAVEHPPGAGQAERSTDETECRNRNTRKAGRIPGDRDSIMPKKDRASTARNNTLRAKLTTAMGIGLAAAGALAQTEGPVMTCAAALGITSREAVALERQWEALDQPTHQRVRCAGNPRGLETTPHINVCVEQTDYRPVPLENLVTLLRFLLGGDVPEGATTNGRIRTAEAPTLRRSVVGNGS